LEGHDAEQYAKDNVDAVVSHIEKGTPSTSTNVPEGHVHEDWNVEQLIALQEAEDKKSSKEV
jgi:hypothetical protein